MININALNRQVIMPSTLRLIYNDDDIKQVSCIVRNKMLYMYRVIDRKGNKYVVYSSEYMRGLS